MAKVVDTGGNTLRNGLLLLAELNFPVLEKGYNLVMVSTAGGAVFTELKIQVKSRWRWWDGSQKFLNKQTDYTEVADEIYALRKQEQNVLAGEAEQDGRWQRMEEIKTFLEEQATFRWSMTSS